MNEGENMRRRTGDREGGKHDGWCESDEGRRESKEPMSYKMEMERKEKESDAGTEGEGQRSRKIARK